MGAIGISIENDSRGQPNYIVQKYLRSRHGLCAALRFGRSYTSEISVDKLDSEKFFFAYILHDNIGGFEVKLVSGRMTHRAFLDRQVNRRKRAGIYHAARTKEDAVDWALSQSSVEDDEVIGYSPAKATSKMPLDYDSFSEHIKSRKLQQVKKIYDHRKRQAEQAFQCPTGSADITSSLRSKKLNQVKEIYDLQKSVAEQLFLHAAKSTNISLNLSRDTATANTDIDLSLTTLATGRGNTISEVDFLMHPTTKAIEPHNAYCGQVVPSRQFDKRLFRPGLRIGREVLSMERVAVEDAVLVVLRNI